VGTQDANITKMGEVSLGWFLIPLSEIFKTTDFSDTRTPRFSNTTLFKGTPRTLLLNSIEVIGKQRFFEGDQYSRIQRNHPRSGMEQKLSIPCNIMN
jgi:hypothetical protein